MQTASAKNMKESERKYGNAVLQRTVFSGYSEMFATHGMDWDGKGFSQTEVFSVRLAFFPGMEYIKS